MHSTLDIQAAFWVNYCFQLFFGYIWCYFRNYTSAKISVTSD